MNSPGTPECRHSRMSVVCRAFMATTELGTIRHIKAQLSLGGRYPVLWRRERYMAESGSAEHGGDGLFKQEGHWKIEGRDDTDEESGR
jgi:hypothetical protein